MRRVVLLLAVATTLWLCRVAVRERGEASRGKERAVVAREEARTVEGEAIEGASEEASEESELSEEEGEESDDRIPVGTAVLSGVVVDRFGIALERVDIEFLAQRPHEHARAITDGNGRFRIANLIETSGTIHARPQHGLLLYEATRLEGIASNAADVRIQLPDLTRIVARLSLPPPHGKITAYTPRHSASIEQHLDGDRLTLYGMPTGVPLLICLRVPGSVPHLLDEVTMQPGTTRDLGLLALDTGVTLRGRATDRRGRPIPGLRVSAGSDIFAVVARCGQDGSFELAHIRAGEAKLQAWHADWPHQEFDAPPVEGPPLEIVMLRGATVEGSVRSIDGIALSSGNIVAHTIEGNEMGGSAVVRADESYRLRLLPGRFLLSVLKRESGETIEVRDEETLSRDILVR